MALSFGSSGNTTNQWNGTSTTNSITNSVGDFIIYEVYVAHSSGGSIANWSASDTLGNVYSAIQMAEWTAGYDVFIFWTQVTNGGTGTTTLTGTGGYAGVQPVFSTFEYWQGTGSINAVDQKASTNSATNAGSVTTLYANEFIYAFTIGLSTSDIPPGYILGVPINGDVVTAGELLASPGAVNPTWTASAEYVGVITFAEETAPVVGDGGTAQAFFRRGTERKWAPWTARESGLLVPERGLVFA